MLQCLEGFKHLIASLLRCCDLDLYNQARGLQDPEVLARETVCMALINPSLSLFLSFKNSL